VIDHVILGVDDVEASKAFYEQALAPLGMGVVMAMPHGVGFGKDGKPILDRRPQPSGPVHVALRPRPRYGRRVPLQRSPPGPRQQKPGLRPYHPSYYGAFVYDPDAYRGGLPPPGRGSDSVVDGRRRRRGARAARLSGVTDALRRGHRLSGGRDQSMEDGVTVLWFVIWLIANVIEQGILVDPVNIWAATLILVIALDLGRQHAPELARPRQTRRPDE
jgi:catechol 2,3-dioxygenase-like lactoylglutathione lyase family enzyme